MGGVVTVQDVLDFLACGSRVVAVGSAAFSEPGVGARLAGQLGEALGARRLTMESVVGIAHTAR